MIRQAHTYLVGAMGGATLIALAIVVFAVLVSAQVFRDWPIAALDGGGEAAVSSGREVPGGSSGVSGAASAPRASARPASGAAGGKPRQARKE
ncbi:MAG: hypothetical protein WA862_10300, partial [Solirubrobacterales bacterium]